MHKKRSIFLVLFIIFIAIGSLKLSQLTIFEPIKVAFHNSESTSYQTQKITHSLSCYNSQDNLSPLPSKLFKLVSWNIHKQQDQGWQQDLDRLSQNADFLLLQENTQNIKNFPFTTALSVSTFSYQDTDSGLITLSPYPAISYCMQAMPEPLILIPKAATAMKFPLSPQHSLLLINVHLINFEWNTTTYRHQLQDIFTLIAQHQGPVIVGGDFNAWNKERTDLIYQLAQQYQLTEVKFKPDERSTFFAYPLDHILVRGITIKSAYSEKLRSSDHNPILLYFALNDEF